MGADLVQVRAGTQKAHNFRPGFQWPVAVAQQPGLVFCPFVHKPAATVGAPLQDADRLFRRGRQQRHGIGHDRAVALVPDIEYLLALPIERGAHEGIATIQHDVRLRGHFYKRIRDRAIRAVMAEPARHGLGDRGSILGFQRQNLAPETVLVIPTPGPGGAGGTGGSPALRPISS
jgi:hypothetical protein